MPRDFDTTREAINAAGGALFDVSASRIAWTIAGPRAATVLASGCPLDFHPRAFPACTCAQSVFGHVNVLVEKRDDSPAFVLMVARSFASVAAQYGCDVLAARPYG
jgi:sarcosine oxidase subunit gamma